MAAVKVGVLALQGAIGLHADALRALGAAPVPVRTADQLDDVDALVIPGGESTTMSLLLESSGLARPAGRAPRRRPADVRHLRRDDPAGGRRDSTAGPTSGASERSTSPCGATRSAARSTPSRPTSPSPALEGGPFHAVFIRAPFVERVGDGVEVLATVDGHPVLVPPGRASPCRVPSRADTDDLGSTDTFLEEL